MSGPGVPNQAQRARDFALPAHHEPEGLLEPSTANLRSPFVVLIAGGSRGIGLGIAISYAKAKASTIIITGRSMESLDAAEKTVRSHNSEVTIVKRSCDVTSQDRVVALADEITKEIGRLDALIINAGTSQPTFVRPTTGLRDFPYGLSKEVKFTDLVDVMNLNVNSPWLMMNSFLPLLESTTDGAQAIVVISSTACLMTDPDLMATSYSLSKLAVTRLVEHCHLAHSKNGISVFALQPGGVKTDLSADVPEGKGWEAMLIDSPELGGAMCVWLTKQKRNWLSGRFVDSRWDVEALEKKREDIVNKDLLKFKMAFS